jgi:hypothetical protein
MVDTLKTSKNASCQFNNSQSEDVAQQVGCSLECRKYQVNIDLPEPQKQMLSSNFWIWIIVKQITGKP